MVTLTGDIVRELLDYDPATGQLTWRRRDRKWFASDRDWKRWNNRFAGMPALTYQDPLGYLRGSILGQPGIAAHSVAFLWMLDRWPEPEPDHENKNRSDNRWSNLRDATRQQNMQNRGMLSTNKSGVTGVHIRYGKFIAFFRNKQLGTFSTLEAAAARREQAVADWWKENPIGLREDRGDT